MRSLSKISIKVHLINKELTLKYGFFGETVIPFGNIKGVELTEKDLPTDKT